MLSILVLIYTIFEICGSVGFSEKFKPLRTVEEIERRQFDVICYNGHVKPEP